MILQIENISKSYGKIMALTGFTATLTPGIYALLGPNGSGKSTLMNILTDNLKADSGRILFTSGNDAAAAEDVLTMGARFREKLGFMPQYPGMYAGFTVERLLWYMAMLKNVGGDLPGMARKEYIREQIDSILHTLELSDDAGKRISALSGGMKQRLGLSQAVLGDPAVLILDEPAAGLDPKQRITVRNFIAKIALNRIVIIATHVVQDVEYIAGEVIMLKKGVIWSMGTPAALVSAMEGKVWRLRVQEEEISALQEKFHVTGISGSSGSEEGIFLRILSEERPDERAEAAAPTLEDRYLWVFGERSPMKERM